MSYVCDCFFAFSYVVNYDFPVHIEDYVHRVGRTGRAGLVKDGSCTYTCIYKYTLERVQYFSKS